jgi:hypothetical protein
MWNFELKFAPVEIIGMLAFVERRTNWSLGNQKSVEFVAPPYNRCLLQEANSGRNDSCSIHFPGDTREGKVREVSARASRYSPAPSTPGFTRGADGKIY